MEKLFIENKYNERICGILDNHPSKKLILVCHGSRGNKDGDLQKDLCDSLSKNFATFRFDFTGNGESEGKLEDGTYSKDIEDLQSLIDYFKNTYEIFAIIGHSKSGSEVLISSLNDNLQTKHYIAISPRVNLLNSQEMVQSYDFQDDLKKNGFYVYPSSNIKHIVTKEYLNDIEMYGDLTNKILNKKFKSLAIFHGDKDEIINISEIHKLKKNSSIKFNDIVNGDHVFSEIEIREELVNKINKYLISLF